MMAAEVHKNRRLQRETRRLHLVALRSTDIDPLHRLFTDPLVRRYLWDDESIARATVVQIVMRSQGSFADFGYGFYGLYLRAEPSRLIGFCGFRPFDEAFNSERNGEHYVRQGAATMHDLELLYGLLPAHWGMGLITEAARSALSYAFAETKVPRIVAATDAPNQRSVAVLERLGMRFDERRELHGLDTLFYSLQNPAALSR